MTSETTPIRSTATKIPWRIGNGLFSVLVALAILALNVPGRTVQRLELYSPGVDGSDFDLVDYVEHGWPFSFFRSPTDCGEFFRSPPSRFEGWHQIAGASQFSIGWFLVDVVLGFSFIAVVVICFQRWRLHRKNIFQLHLLDLFVLTGMLAIFLGLYGSMCSRHNRESEIARIIAYNRPGWSNNQQVDWKRADPFWLRMFRGASMGEIADCVSGIEVLGRKIEYVAELPHVEVLRIDGPVPEKWLITLEQLPQLRAFRLTKSWSEVRVQNDDRSFIRAQDITLPRLPKLQGLNLHGSSFQGAGLESLRDIEVLDLTYTIVDDSSVPALTRLKHLKKLSVGNTKISKAGIEQLRRALPNCSIESDF